MEVRKGYKQSEVGVIPVKGHKWMQILEEVSYLEEKVNAHLAKMGFTWK